MTQLSDKDHQAQMADMKSFDEQMPSVGIKRNITCLAYTRRRLLRVRLKRLQRKVCPSSTIPSYIARYGQKSISVLKQHMSPQGLRATILWYLAVVWHGTSISSLCSLANGQSPSKMSSLNCWNRSSHSLTSSSYTTITGISVTDGAAICQSSGT